MFQIELTFSDWWIHINNILYRIFVYIYVFCKASKFCTFKIEWVIWYLTNYVSFYVTGEFNYLSIEFGSVRELEMFYYALTSIDSRNLHSYRLYSCISWTNELMLIEDWLQHLNNPMTLCQIDNQILKYKIGIHQFDQCPVLVEYEISR